MSSSSWSSPPPRRSTSSSEKTSRACSSVSRSALRARAIVFLASQGGPPSAPGHLLLRHAGLEQRDRAVHLAQPPDDREHEPAGALAVRLELLGERERRAQVARHERVREVVGLRRVVARGQSLHVLRSGVGRGMQGDRELLELAREPLLARAHPRHELLGALAVQLQPELAAALHRPLGQLPGLRGRAVADVAAGLLRRVAQRLERLAADDQDQHGVGRQVGQRRLERPQLAGLPRPGVVHEQVAHARVEGEAGQRRGHLGGLGRAGVEGLEAARAALLLGPLPQRAGARRRSSRRRRRRRGRRASGRPPAQCRRRLRAGRVSARCARARPPSSTVSVTVPSRSVR